MSPDDDPLYDKAALVAKNSPRLCVANLQRTLAIGYNRAYRLMETMVGEGLVERFDTGFGGVGYRLAATRTK